MTKERLTPTLTHGVGPGALKKERGFTLVELLVALSMMALLALMSWRGIDGMVRAQEHMRQRADHLLVLQTALAQWGADLDAMLALPGASPVDWNGQALRLTRSQAGDPGEGVRVVAWTRRYVGGANHWLRWQSPLVRTRGEWDAAWQQAAQWAANPGNALRRSEVALLPMDNWRVYYFRGGAWSNPQSSQGAEPPGSGGP